MVGIGRIDPQRVMVDVNAISGPLGRERLAAIERQVQQTAEGPDLVGSPGIDAYLAVVHRTRIHVALAPPCRAAVVRSVHTAGSFVLDDGIHDARVARRDREANAADRSVGEPPFQLLPCRSPVERLVQSAAGAAADEPPRAPTTLIRGREQRAAVGVHRYVHHTGIAVDEEDLLPRATAVASAEEAALVVGTPEMSKSGDEHDIRIARVDDDTPDMMRVAQPHVRPCLAAIERAVDAVAPRRALPVVRLARPHPDDVGIRRRDRQIADRQHAAGPVEDGLPRHAVVDALEYAAGRRSDEDDLRLAGDGLDIVNASAERGRANLPPRQVVKKSLERAAAILRAHGTDERQNKRKREDHVSAVVCHAHSSRGQVGSGTGASRILSATQP
jgi:hypothetical protein